MECDIPGFWEIRGDSDADPWNKERCAGISNLNIVRTG